MRISDFIDRSNQVDSPADILALMEEAANDLGFDKYAYCALTQHERYVTGDNPAPAIALNYPTSWTDYYFEHDYQAKDPVVLRAPTLDRPFLWDSIGEELPLTQGQATMMEEAREARLRDGVGVPLHGAQGNVCLLTFAAGDGHPDPAAELNKLALLSAQFHAVYSEIGRTKIAKGKVPFLTDRELECLRWIAVGKTSWDIGVILGISESAVKFRVKRTFQKLGTNNRIMAVVKAIRRGLIGL
jgi:LuxR family quorum-sensing system transcriptional regulator CciR